MPYDSLTLIDNAAPMDAKFRDAVLNSLDAIAILRGVRDGRGRIVDFTVVDLNARCEELYRVERASAINRSVSDLLPMIRTAGILDKYAQVVETGAPVEEEFEIDSAILGLVWLRHQIVRQGDGVVVTSRDISVRKRGEQALAFLAESSALLAASLDYESTLEQVNRLLVPRLADFCMVHALEPDGRYRPLASTHVAPDKEPLVAALAKYYGSHPGKKQSLVSQVIRTGEPLLVGSASPEQIEQITGNQEALCLFRELRPSSYMIVPLVARGAARGTLTLATSDSRRPYTADDLALAKDVGWRIALALDNARLYQDAQDAVHEREALLSVASHELSNPLTTLLGYAGLLDRRLMPGKTATAAEQGYVRMIREQGSRLRLMLDMLLDVARLDGDQLTIDLEPVDLDALGARIVAEVTPTLTRHTIRYTGPGRPAIVQGDELRLEQVVRNLLGNAVKYSPDGGAIAVDVVADDRRVTFRVRDPGIGIPAEALPRIFQRFARIRSEESEYIGGLGVGLYVVKEIVGLHGGTIDVASVQGQGSTFTVSLPASATPA